MAMLSGSWTDRTLGRGLENHLEDGDRPGLVDGSARLCRQRDSAPGSPRGVCPAPPVLPSTVVRRPWILSQVTNSSATEGLSCVFLPGARPANVPGGCVRERLGGAHGPGQAGWRPDSYTQLRTWLWGPEHAATIRPSEHAVLTSIPPVYSNQ